MVKVYISRWQVSINSVIGDTLDFLNWEGIVSSEAKVFLKPNLTYPIPKHGVTTSPEFIEAVVKAIS